jgi:glycosyltransferase involved in cell wall biosynthesis
MREMLAGQGVDFTFAFGQPAPVERDRGDEGSLHWGLRTKNLYLSPNGMMFYQQIPDRYYREADLIIFPHENKFLLTTFLLRKNIPSCRTAFFGHGLNFQSSSSASPGNLLKRQSAMKTDWWFAYTEKTKDVLTSWGMPEDRITTINNAIDTTALTRWRTEVSADELEALRTSLGIQGTRVGLFLGSLYHDKRLDFLFSCADRLRHMFPDFSFIVIGDGPLREKVRAFCSTRNWAVWVGALNGREKVLHLMLARVMLSPGLVGLNILDSFALGLPMVTTDCMIHSPEIAYLRSGENGLLTSDGEDAFIQGVTAVLEDSVLADKLGAGCLVDAKRYTIENMAENFHSGILKALSAERIRRSH